MSQAVQPACSLGQAVRAARGLLLGLAVVLSAGCASLTAPVLPGRALAAPQDVQCIDWYAALDAATDGAGVRDAGAVRVAGFSHLRVDRFTASLRDKLPAPNASQAASAAHTALHQRLVQLDLEARAFEITNLPAATRKQLANTALDAASSTAAQSANALDALDAPDALLQRTRQCASRLAALDLTTPQRLGTLLERLDVPDSYTTSYRALGAYALTRYPFAAGVRQLEAQRLVVASADSPPPAGTRRLRYNPPSDAAAVAANPSNTANLSATNLSATNSPTANLSAADLRRILTPPPNDPLQVPAPSPADLERLFAHFAPSFDIDTASNDDLPGTLAWQPTADTVGTASSATAHSLAVDTTAPALYRQTATTRYGGASLLQLVYTLWFPARPAAPGAMPDLLAGKLDGVVWRVTLAPDGTPLVFDSMHPCGCYHWFYPTPAAQPKPAPQAGTEWAFIPQSLPQAPANAGQPQRMLLRIAPVSHFVDRVTPVPAANDPSSTTHYAWRDYHSLRSLPLGWTSADGMPGSPPASRSVFNPQGFIDGTDRAERFIFWPMGIARAGSMRQWGKHATAFVGRRHFDDATLMEQRFNFAPAHFAP